MAHKKEKLRYEVARLQNSITSAVVEMLNNRSIQIRVHGGPCKWDVLSVYEGVDQGTIGIDIEQAGEED